MSISVAFQYIQFKIEISGGSVSNLPIVNSVTINWTTGSAGQPQTLQNVASVYWRNRYWLSAAGPSATANNTILVRGKKTFQSPWMLKDWNILSFTRYFDNLYGGSSVDGSIYQLDTGYSKAGLTMNSYFETGDFIFGGLLKWNGRARIFLLLGILLIMEIHGQIHSSVYFPILIITICIVYILA